MHPLPKLLGGRVGQAGGNVVSAAVVPDVDVPHGRRHRVVVGVHQQAVDKFQQAVMKRRSEKLSVLLRAVLILRRLIKNVMIKDASC